MRCKERDRSPEVSQEESGNTAVLFVITEFRTLLPTERRGRMDTYITATEARQRFLQLLDEVQQGDQVIVTRHGTPAAVLIDFERLETLKSLARLWQDPEALRAMKEANEQVKTGRVSYG